MSKKDITETESTSKKEEDEEKGVWFETLQPGEIYETTKIWSWADYDHKSELIEISPGERLLYRSTQYYKPKKELSIFYWLKNKCSLCLVCSKEAGLIHVKHIPWAER